MAYTDTVGDILRVTIAAQQPDTQVQMNDINFVCSVSGGGDSRASLGEFVLNTYIAQYLPYMSSDSILYGYKVSLVNRKPPPAPVALVDTGPGAVSQPPLATQTRPVLKWQTAFSGRKYRGRLFLFTPANSTITSGGIPLTALNTAMGLLGTALLAGLSTGGTTWLPAIAHRAKGPPVTWTYDIITGRTVPGMFGTQRKSGNYGRQNPAPW